MENTNAQMIATAEHEAHERALSLDTAQLVSVALYSPKPDETVQFFYEMLGMEISHREGQSVYLRAYEEFYQYSLKITERDQPGLEEITWRAKSPQALDRIVNSLTDTDAGTGWTKNDYAHGPAYKFTTPDGHRMKVLWELDYFVTPDDLRSKLRNRPSKRPLRGVPVRRLDHVNLSVSDVAIHRDFMVNNLGFKVREEFVGKDEVLVGSWMSVSPLSHEIAVMRDVVGGGNRFHHVAFWYGVPQHLMDIADVFSERDIIIEGGPAKHGIAPAYFMYAFEPGGNRIELFGDTGILIFDPDWQSITWNQSNEVDAMKAIVWVGGSLPASFFNYAMPPLPGAELSTFYG
jgi:catechol 2,3-dioxygenase